MRTKAPSVDEHLGEPQQDDQDQAQREGENQHEDAAAQDPARDGEIVYRGEAEDESRDGGGDGDDDVGGTAIAEAGEHDG